MQVEVQNRECRQSYHSARMSIPKAPTASAPTLLTVTSRLTAPLIEPLSPLLPLEDELEPPEKLDVLAVELPVEVAVELVSSDESRPDPPELEQLELDPCDVYEWTFSQEVLGRTYRAALSDGIGTCLALVAIVAFGAAALAIVGVVACIVTTRHGASAVLVLA